MFEQRWNVRRRGILEAAAFSLLAVLVVASAVTVKESREDLVPLAAVDAATDAELHLDPGPLLHGPSVPPEPEPIIDPFAQAQEAPGAPGVVRWFNGRPVRQVRSVKMEVTAYSPDEISCPGTADGITATLHSVNTNAMRLVAADPRILPYGSMLSIPGYDDGNIVPVLDCGGAIKGHRLDVLYATHEEALKWGRQHLRIVVWEYADGGKPENPRKER
jgi:3D (Asp-Asp-Asp) domain-containing protein